MQTTDKLLKAKVQLVLEQPFFATLALRMKYIPDNTVKTAVTNGNAVRFNPGYIDTLSIDEIKTMLAEEVMHVALLHHTRRNNRDSHKWNMAADYAVTPLLRSSGFVLPNNSLINPDYENKSAEQIYNLLPTPPPDKQDDSPGNSEGGTGDVEDPPGDIDVQQEEAEMKQVIAQAAMIAKRQGKLPAHLARMVSEVLEPRIDWREALARFLAEITKNDYTFKKPSNRYLHFGLYLPSLETEESGKVIIIADTSYSIDEALMNQFAGEVQDITSTFNTSLQVIYVDAEVSGVQDIEPDEPVKLQPKGGGGTDFRPGFDYIEANDLQPKAVIYLTDGECDDFPTPPDYPVLWAQFSDASFIPPFGEVIHVC